MHWYRPTIIEGIIVNESGDTIGADIRIETLHTNRNDKPLLEADVEGAISLPVPLQGMHTLVIREQYSGAVRRMLIELPPRGDNVFVDIGRIVVREQSQLTVRAPDGTPLTKGDEHLLRLGFRTWEFVKQTAALPAGVHELAQRSHRTFFAVDPRHPAVRGRRLYHSDYWCVDIGFEHRALAVLQGSIHIWFFIGSPTDLPG